MCVFVGIVGCVLDFPTLLMFRAFFTELFLKALWIQLTRPRDDSGISFGTNISRNFVR